MTLIVFVLAIMSFFATGMVIAWQLLDLAIYRRQRKAVERGDLDIRPGSELHVFVMNAIGANPDIEHRYVTYHIPPGQAAVVRGSYSPQAAYYSLVLYDLFLQTVPPAESEGRTHYIDRQLTLDEQGQFTVVLARKDRGWPNFLDITALPKGVIFERHIGASPQAKAQVTMMSEEQAAQLIDKKAAG